MFDKALENLEEGEQEKYLTVRRVERARETVDGFLVVKVEEQMLQHQLERIGGNQVIWGFGLDGLVDEITDGAIDPRKLFLLSKKSQVSTQY